MASYSPKKLYEASQREFYNPLLFDIAQRVIGSIVDQTSDQKKRIALDELEIMGAGAGGVVYNPSNNDYSRLYAIKQARNKNYLPNLRNDFEIGKRISVLRQQNVYNFVQYYHLFDCGDRLALNGKRTVGWCSTTDSRYRVPFIVMERIPDAVTLTDFIATHTITLKIFTSIFLQLTLALDMVARTIGLAHRDLHSSNVLIRTLDGVVGLPYQYGCSQVSVESSFLAIIIDYDRSTVDESTMSIDNLAPRDVYLLLFAFYNHLSGKKTIGEEEKRTIRVLRDLMAAYMRLHTTESQDLARLMMMRNAKAKTPVLHQEYTDLLKKLAYNNRSDTTLTVHDLVSVLETSLQRAGGQLSDVFAKVESTRDTKALLASCDDLFCTTEEQIAESPPVSYSYLMEEGVKRELLTDKEEETLYRNTEETIEEIRTHALESIRAIQTISVSNLSKRATQNSESAALNIVLLKELASLFFNNIGLWKEIDRLDALILALSTTAIKTEEFELLQRLRINREEMVGYLTPLKDLEMLAASAERIFQRKDLHPTFKKDIPLFDFYSYGIDIAVSLLSGVDGRKV